MKAIGAANVMCSIFRQIARALEIGGIGGGAGFADGGMIKFWHLYMAGQNSGMMGGG